MPDQLAATTNRRPSVRPRTAIPDAAQPPQDAPLPNRSTHPARAVWRLAVIALAMSGLRLDRRAWRASFVSWVIGWSGCLALYTIAFQSTLLGEKVDRAGLSIIYLAVVCIVYYGGLSVVLGTALRRRIVKAFGAARGYTVAEAALGIVFLNQALCQTAVMEHHAARLPDIVPSWVYQIAGAALVIIGLACKIWATSLTGLDTYYYRDMFVGHGNGGVNDGFVVRGPYRFMNNPMYGVGNLTAYGGALWYNSWVGLGVAALMQALIFLFYGLFEKPFIKRTYLSNGRAPGTTPR